MSLSGLLNQSITYTNPSTTEDEHGNANMGSPVTVDARFERVNKTVVDAQGDRVAVQGRVFTGPGDAIERGAKIVYDGQDYRVMTREDVVVGTGSLHHRELMVQEWNFS